ncbi:hypothetical protein [Embleya sp. NBC_00896]|uniref:hypothetical protein n=1 Tax=Embleya sp. NBC_00896 TaxID=2975961 RepID=UPI002F90E8C3|nr:hypothetical protein OG928_47025 [Embleya sp. NBC_00896]
MPAASDADIQTKADQRLAEIAARPDIEPALADFLRETIAVSLEYKVRATEEGKKRTLDDQVLNAKATRERLCTRDGQGRWAPGSLLTTMRDLSVNELAKDMLKDKQVDDEATAAVVAGRMLTAIETKLCQGKQASG